MEEDVELNIIRGVSKRKKIVKIKRVCFLMILWSIFFSDSYSQISSTSQNLDGFSVKKGVKASGGLTFSNDFYAGSDSLVVRDPYAFYLSGNLNLNVFGIELPFGFSLSNTQRSFLQPFNRFQLNPRYKWAHLLLGTNVMSLSKYTLSDHDFCGVGVELTPGKWSVSAMYGRLRKAIEFNPIKENFNTVAYKRIGYGAKVGYQSKTGLYEITFFHGEDKEGSLSDPIPDSCFLTPKRNTAISASVTQRFLKYFNVHAEYAFSVYNTNLVNDDCDEVVSKTLFDRIFHRKKSDKMTDAFNASIGYQGPVVGVMLQYERISPYYSSLGGYYFNEDEQNMTISPNVKLLKGKLNISGQFGLQFNNLNNDRAADTRHIVYSANASYNSGKLWMITACFSNFNSYTKVKPISFPYYTNDLDSLNFYQVSRSLMVSNVFNFGEGNVKNTISATATYQCANSLSEEKLVSFADYFGGNLAYNQQQIPLSLGWSAYANVNYSNSTMYKTIYFGPGAAVNKSFFKGVLGISLSASYNLNKVEQRKMGSMINTGLSASYSLKPKSKKLGNHTFSLSSTFTRYLGSMVMGDNKFESLTNLTYQVGF